MRVLCAVGGAALGAGAVYFGRKYLGKTVLGALGALGAAGKKEDAGVLIRHIRRYAFAASQDKSPIVGLTHASYALNSLDALEEQVGQANIAKTGVDPKRLRQFITALQDTHANKLQGCDPFLTEILAMEAASGGGIDSLGPWAAPTGA